MIPIKEMAKFFKVVWACAKKVTRSPSEESRL